MAVRTDFLKKFPFGISLLFLLLFSMTLSIRKVFFVFFPDDSGNFNEYTDISLYFSDLVIVILFLYIILENKNNILSISWWKKMFHVEHRNTLFILPLPFLLWSTFSSFWAKSSELAWYTSLRLWEGYGLVLILFLFIVPRGTMKNLKEVCSTWNIWKKLFQGTILLGAFQSLIALGQFWTQGSLGLTFLKESSFSVTEPGIAKVILFDQILIRPYGLFLHPNVLSGFLGITLLFTIAYPLVFHRKMFHVEQFLTQSPNVPRGTSTILVQRAFCHSAFQLFTHFLKSRLALLWSSSTLFCFWSVPRGTIPHPITKCSTWNNREFLAMDQNEMFHVEQFLTQSPNVPRGTMEKTF